MPSFFDSSDAVEQLESKMKELASIVSCSDCNSRFFARASERRENVVAEFPTSSCSEDASSSTATEPFLVTEEPVISSPL